MHIIRKFGLSESLNPNLCDRVCENIIPDLVRGKESIAGRSTGMNFHHQNIREVDLLITWIKNLLPEVSTKFASRIKEDYYGYDLNAFKIVDCWGLAYQKGESLVEHCHFPMTLSFTYVVKSPPRSFPLMIENTKIILQEGECLFFLSSDYHSVKTNKCDGRCIIVGNILYSP